MLSSLYLRTLTLTTLASCLLITGCSRDSATQCIFNDDCAQPYEYCSSQTGLCTAYECLEDSDCKSTERCSLITNTCILKPRPDMSVMPEMGREDMDDRPDLQGPVDMPDTPDLGPPDLGPPDLGPPPDMGPPRDTIKPEIVRITPAPGSSVDFTDDLPDTITVDFSEPLDAISLSPFSVELTDETGAEIDLEVTYDDTANRAIITTAPGASPSRTYRLELDQVIRDAAGNTLDRDRSFIFYAPFPRDEAHHELATKWAPVIHQELEETGQNLWRHDVPSRVDFDGDWDASNNLANLPAIAPGDYRAQVYYHVVSTESHHYITYMLYYPSRTVIPDGSMDDVRLEHDFTGVMLVVERESDDLLIVEGVRLQENTDLIIAFMNQDRDVDLPGQGRIRGRFSHDDLTDGTHYPLYIPARRHEACNWNDPEVLPPFDVCVHPAQSFRDGFMGVIMTLAPQGQGLEQAMQASPDAPFTMNYELISFVPTFWERRDYIGATALFGRGFSYSPEGGRPAGPSPDESLYLPQSLASQDPESLGKSPFQWLTQPARRNDGQWLVDPTWTVRQRYSVPDSPVWSATYCDNLPLAIDRRSEPACMTSAMPQMP